MDTTFDNGAVAAGQSSGRTLAAVLRAVDLAAALWRDWLSRRALGLIVFLALALRFAILPIAAIHHSDEIFQYIEPAHRLVTGYGIETWEWREGIRSYFVPVLFALPIALSEWVRPGSLDYLWMIRGGLAVASLSVVLSCYVMGNRISRFHGLVAAFVAAIWFELVYFSVHSLSEPIAVALIIPAAAILCGVDKASYRARIVAGLLLGLAVIVRFQYGPAIGIFVLMTCGASFRRAWLPVGLGGGAALALSAAVDIAFGSPPFLWIYNNFAANIVDGRAAQYGVEHPLYYLVHIAIYNWQSSALPIVALSALAVRRYPALFAMALVNFLVHSLVGHKEPRFLFLTMAIMTLLFGVGLAEALRYLGREQTARARFLLVCGALAWVTITSVTLAGGERFRYQWTAHLTELRAMKSARTTPGLCGLGLYDMTFDGSGGYTYLNRGVPMYLLAPSAGVAALRRASPSFNVAIAPQGANALAAQGFVRGDCFDPSTALDAGTKVVTCVYRRRGNCTPGAPEVNRTMIEKNL